MTLSSKQKVFQIGDSDDLIITANAPVEGQANSWRQIAFKASNIDYLFQVDGDIAGIVLKNGITIPIRMEFDRLKRAIYEPDMSTGTGIDFTLITGPATASAEPVRLSKAFNPAAEGETAEKTSELQIIMFIHAQPSDRGFRRIVVPYADIGYFEPNNARKDTETFFQLKAGKLIEGLKEFYAAIPIDHFGAFLNGALRDGATTLDLSDRTRPQNPKGMVLS